MESDNPWSIQSIYEFQFFNCPACTFKNQSKQQFVNHALETHPECSDHFSNVSDGSLQDIKLSFVKKEDACDQDNEDSLVDCEPSVELTESDYEYCETCHQYFRSKDSLKEHIRIHHSKEDAEDTDLVDLNNMFECKDCSETFSDHHKLIEHAEKVHTQSSKLVTNPSDQDVHAGLQDLPKESVPSRNTKLKTEVKGFLPDDQDFEEVTYDSSYTYNAKIIKCPTCQSEFDHYYRLSKHLLLDHGEESASLEFSKDANNPPRCSKCDQTLLDNEDLAYHFFKEHWTKCAQCLAPFDSMVSLVKHGAAHTL